MKLPLYFYRGLISVAVIVILYNISLPFLIFD